ncbi:MAG: hypothetical protein GEU71_12605 [Actinobacteria bacterium]|nr:hypothetical protein [Actinomycetota bacterium]
MRSAVRYLASSLLVGVLSVGLAWAGAGLVPVDPPELPEAIAGTEAAVGGSAQGGNGAKRGAFTEFGPPPPGYVHAGAAKVSIEPRPEDYDGTWVQDRDQCATLSEAFVTQLPDSAEHLASAGSPWPENPNCLYMGGYGIGPMNPITSWDQEYGLYVRSAVLQGPEVDGVSGALVLTIIDGEGYFWDYGNKCDDCGIKQLSAELGAELGIPKESFITAATHSHTSPDFIGGWGFVPDWYMDQVGDAIRESVKSAWAERQPAILETGEQLARGFNHERRDTYRSAEEQQLTWMRAVAPKYKRKPAKTVFTLGAFAAHPVTADESSGVAHGDWPVVFEKTLEDRFGGVGLHMMTGLGNISPDGGTMMGGALAGIIPEVGAGMRVTDTSIRVAQKTWAQPATNVPLTGLGLPGFFDRKFLGSPAEVRTGKSPDTAPCESASPVSVEVPATAAFIGNQLAITAGPGELFSNLTNTIKEKSGALVTMPLAQANDALGYLPQSFELNPVGQQGLGFVAGGVAVVNYEDSYSIDRCFGDKVLEETIGMLQALRG